MATLAEIQANATAKRNAPLDPATIANTATGVNQAAKNTTNAMVGKPPVATPPPQTASSWIGNMSGFKTPKAGIPGANPGVTPPGGVSTAPGVVSTPGVGTPGVTPPPSNTPPTSTAPDFTSQKNDAYKEFETSAGLTPENQKALDMTRMELSNIGQGETYEQMYNRAINESGYKNIQDTLLKANAEMDTQKEGLDAARTEVFNSGDGVMDAGLQQLRARNSRDFITNLSHLSNIASNSQAQLTAIKDNLDTVMQMRKADRLQKAEDLKNRIDMLQNTVSPTQLALLKTKLDQKLASIAKEEQAQADIVKLKNETLLKNGDVNSTDPYIQKQGVLKAINDAMTYYGSKGVVLKIPASAHADKIIQLMKSGKTFDQAFQEDFMNPLKSSPTVQAIDAQNTGSDWKYATVKKYNPSTGGYDDNPIFYRTSGGKVEYQDMYGNPINMNSTTTGLMSLAGQTDLSTLSDKYPNVAAFKNNNPSGITWEATSQGLKDAWKQAGVQFTQGTPRPENEGGSYVKFASAEDGIKAKMIAMTRGYGNSTVNQYLDKWGTGSNNIKTSFDKNKKINDLNESEWNELVTKQIAWESPSFLKEYEKAKGSIEYKKGESTFTPSEVKQFNAYDGKNIPEEYNTPVKRQQFIDKYNAWAGSQKTQAPRTINSGNDILSIDMSSKANEQQRNAVKYAARMLNASNDLSSLESEFNNRSYAGQTWQTYAPNVLKSGDQQIMESRKQDFITAVLRKESGASISPTEFAKEETKYFPVPGDTPETLISKQKAREFAIKAMLSEAGNDANGVNIASMYNGTTQETQNGEMQNQIDAQTGQGTLNNTYVSKGGFSYNLNDYQ